MTYLSNSGIIFVALFCPAILAVAAAEPRCHLSQLWKCQEIASDGLNTLPKRSIPHTEEELKEMCQKTEDAMDCAFKFRDSCMTPIQKELLIYVVEGMIAYQEDICDPSSDTHKKYLEHANCLNEVSQLEEVKSELEYILAVMEKAETVELNQKIIYSCCAYAQTYGTFLKLGQEHCGKDATDAIENMLSIGVAQLPEVMCNGFNADEERCKSVLPPDGSKPSGTIKSAVLDTLKEQFKRWLE